MIKKNLQKIIIAPIIISTVLISGAFPKNITFAATLKVVNANSINVRSGAGASYKLLGKLTRNTKISVTSETKGGVSLLTMEKLLMYVVNI